MNRTTSLIHDTLYEKNSREVATSCLTSNQSGIELANVKENILTDLELAIREVDCLIKSKRLTRAQVPGFDYVLGAYLINATRHSEIHRVADFIKNCGVVVFCRFLLMIPAFFRRTDRGYAFGVAPPTELHTLIDSLRGHYESEIAHTARRVYELLGYD